MTKAKGLFRGTTPTLTFKLSIPIEQLSAVNIALAQDGGLLLEYTLSDCVIEDENTITLTLTQEDTLKLSGDDSKDTLRIQLRALTQNGEAVASRVYVIGVRDILRDGVIM